MGGEELFCLKATESLTTGKVLGWEKSIWHRFCLRSGSLFSVISVFDVFYKYTLIYSLYITPYPLFSLALHNSAALGMSQGSRTWSSWDRHGRAIWWSSCLPIIYSQNSLWWEQLIKLEGKVLLSWFFSTVSWGKLGFLICVMLMVGTLYLDIKQKNKPVS